jgi:hypothetical protein
MCDLEGTKVDLLHSGGVVLPPANNVNLLQKSTRDNKPECHSQDDKQMSFRVNVPIFQLIAAPATASLASMNSLTKAQKSVLVNLANKH